jgi:hypothetical protein
MSFVRLFSFLFFIVLAAGCGYDAPTFPQERIKEHIKEICFNDYGIENVEVEIVGKTLGVHLPLEQLFEKDVESLMATGKIKDIGGLLQLTPEAIEKIQDVIFTTSRVIFSSDSDIDFYVLKATDYENTGIEFILANHVQDVKRVRFWDIPLSEYYKRSYRDMKMNRSVFLKKPVLELFRNVGSMDLTEIFKRYFTSQSTLKDISPFFYAILMEYEFKKDIDIKVLGSKVRVFKADEVLVYIQVEETYEPKPSARGHQFIYPSGTVLEYIFILQPSKSGMLISRVLPFNYVAPDGTIKKIEFPENLRLYENIETWPSDFEIEEIFIDEFLAAQLTRRVQADFQQDPKVFDHFEDATAEFVYYPERDVKAVAEEAAREEGLAKYFLCRLEIRPSDPALLVSADFIRDPYVEHAVTVSLKEFVKVLRSYDFKDYDFLRLEIDGTDNVYELTPKMLEQFRKKRPPLRDILGKSAVIHS